MIDISVDVSQEPSVERMNLEDRVELAIPLAKMLASHEVEYVNDQSLEALDRFLLEHGTYLNDA